MLPILYLYSLQCPISGTDFTSNNLSICFISLERETLLTITSADTDRCKDGKECILPFAVSWWPQARKDENLDATKDIAQTRSGLEFGLIFNLYFQKWNWRFSAYFREQFFYLDVSSAYSISFCLPSVLFISLFPLRSCSCNPEQRSLKKKNMVFVLK